MFAVLDPFWTPIVRVTPLKTMPIPLLTPDVQCLGSWSLMTTNCTRYSTQDTVRIVNSFITIPITRHYNHSQLSITLLRVDTIITLIRSWLQSLIPLLHVYTVCVHYTLIFTALLHLRSPNRLTTFSLLGFSPNSHYHWLSHTVAHAKSSLHTAKLLPRTYSANSLLKTLS
jgi:hypothetical protein